MSFKRLMISAAVIVNSLLIPVIAMPAVAHAVGECANVTNSKPKSSFLGFPTWYKYIPTEGNCEFERDPDISKIQSQFVVPIALAIFEIVLRVAGLVAVGFIIAGGFQYITSQGEPDSLKHARGTIINALIGLVIAISATVIVNLASGIFT